MNLDSEARSLELSSVYWIYCCCFFCQPRFFPHGFSCATRGTKSTWSISARFTPGWSVAMTAGTEISGPRSKGTRPNHHALGLKFIIMKCRPFLRNRENLNVYSPEIEHRYQKWPYVKGLRFFQDPSFWGAPAVSFRGCKRGSWSLEKSFCDRGMKATTWNYCIRLT